jgi:hypothetical protein
MSHEGEISVAKRLWRLMWVVIFFAAIQYLSFEESATQGLPFWRRLSCRPSNPQELKQAHETACHVATLASRVRIPRNCYRWGNMERNRKRVANTLASNIIWVPIVTRRVIRIKSLIIDSFFCLALHRMNVWPASQISRIFFLRR